MATSDRVKTNATREERLAEQLRLNLARRKGQARARRAGDEDDRHGLVKPAPDKATDE